MFYLRINKLRIIDNMERPRFLGVLGPDVAQVKIISFITTDNMPLPDMSAFIYAKTRDEQLNILRDAVSQVMSSRVLTTIQNVKDNHLMYFGDTGYVLYRSQTLPEYLDWQLIAYESDRNIEDAGILTEAVLQSSEFDQFSGNLLGMVKKARNPAYLAAVSIGKFATSVMAQILKKNRDDMVGILYMSLNRKEHYPHGERKRNDVPDLTNNMYIDYTIFGFEE